MAIQFKGATALTKISLGEDDLKLIKNLFKAATVSGNVVHVADEIETFLSSAAPGELQMTHDQIALTQEVLNKATFDAKARPVAATLKRELMRALQTFYTE